VSLNCWGPRIFIESLIMVAFMGLVNTWISRRVWAWPRPCVSVCWYQGLFLQYSKFNVINLLYLIFWNRRAGLLYVSVWLVT